MRVCVEYCRNNISIYCSDLWYKWFSCDNLEHPLKSGAEIYVTVTWVECCVHLQTVFEVTARFVTPWMSLLFCLLCSLVLFPLWCGLVHQRCVCRGAACRWEAAQCVSLFLTAPLQQATPTFPEGRSRYTLAPPILILWFIHLDAVSWTNGIQTHTLVFTP